MELKNLLLLLIFASPLSSCAQQIVSHQQTEKFSTELQNDRSSQPSLQIGIYKRAR